jgi:hypothetical protein
MFSRRTTISTDSVWPIGIYLSIVVLLIYDRDKMPASDKPYLNFVVDPELLKRLDDFRFKHRFATRAGAIKWLLDWALRQKPVPEAVGD